MVYPQAAHLVREYFQATNWSLDNHYHALTSPSRNLLDFPIPPGLHLSLSHRPTAQFASSLALSTLVPSALPTYPATPAPVLGPPPSQLLSGQLTYVFSSAPLGLTSTKQAAEGEDRIKFRDVVQSFRVGELPSRPELRDEVRPTWLAGKRVEKTDFLLYGRLYAPSPRLDALYIHRLTPTLQTLVSLISVPSPLPTPQLTWQLPDDPSAPPAAPNPPPSSERLSELEIKLMQDTGRWSGEYSYAVGDSMWGARGLYNFGKWGGGQAAGTGSGDDEASRERVVDEEEEMSTGLKGRWSAGGEVFFSAQERSGGVSTAVRFSTLPESTNSPHLPPGALSQPPTTITATLNPIMGQLSTAYSVGVSNDTALASRFDFNLYSYDADLTFGGEWFQRRKRKALTEVAKAEMPLPSSFDAFGREQEGAAVGGAVEDTKTAPSSLTLAPTPAINGAEEDEVIGVLKLRASTNTDLALLWEGRLGDFLISAGIVADLRLASQKGGRMSPIRSVGLGVQYWG
ncbi:hypothetical protein BCR35DRAFT_323000 [Leucosporidium creatinivorum]|uniref:Mitochondrial distribution and morphology protein 10 n=1 Tax=Leucosporidium creatinivorum TaxID=106004 RepID=A0A1Y2BX78_9BASI|nr:hypothetical protein BCR35DRAFT_323000 [Leucosporidium creatinivorum]